MALFAKCIDGSDPGGNAVIRLQWNRRKSATSAGGQYELRIEPKSLRRRRDRCIIIPLVSLTPFVKPSANPSAKAVLTDGVGCAAVHVLSCEMPDGKKPPLRPNDPELAPTMMYSRVGSAHICCHQTRV